VVRILPAPLFLLGIALPPPRALTGTPEPHAAVARPLRPSPPPPLPPIGFPVPSSRSPTGSRHPLATETPVHTTPVILRRGLLPSGERSPPASALCSWPSDPRRTIKIRSEAGVPQRLDPDPTAPNRRYRFAVVANLSRSSSIRRSRLDPDRGGISAVHFTSGG
jgi:hypothetical protein